MDYKFSNKIFLSFVIIVTFATGTISQEFAEIKLISCFGGVSDGRTGGVYVNGKLAYTHNAGGDFRVWNISDLCNIRQIAVYNAKEDASWQAKPDLIKFEGYHHNQGGISQSYNMGMGVFGEKILAFIMPGHQSLQALDATDPQHISNMGGRRYAEFNFQTGGGTDCIIAKNGYIFQTNWGGFIIYRYSPDIAAANDSAPYKYISKVDYFGGSEARDYARSIALSDDLKFAYTVCDNKMAVYSISFAMEISLVSKYERVGYPYRNVKNQGRCVEISNGLLFLGTTKDLRLFDLSNPAAPIPIKDAIGKDVIYPTLGAVLDVKVYKKYAFIFFGPTENLKDSNETGLEVVDISDPCKPEFVDSFSFGGYTGKNDYYRKMVLIPDKGIIVAGADAFYVLDVSDYTGKK